MRMTLLIALVLAHGLVEAQTPQSPSLPYNLAELRFVDVDQNGGDGFRLAGSYRISGNWLILGGLTELEFNNGIDWTTIEFGGGYVWPYRPDWDLVANVRIVSTDVDFPLGGTDDTGLGITGGVRGMIAPQFEVRGSVNHVTVGDDDTYLEFAGDYHFTRNFAAGLSFDVGGDLDAWSVGARWFFR